MDSVIERILIARLNHLFTNEVHFELNLSWRNRLKSRALIVYDFLVNIREDWYRSCLRIGHCSCTINSISSNIASNLKQFRSELDPVMYIVLEIARKETLSALKLKQSVLVL